MTGWRRWAVAGAWGVWVAAAGAQSVGETTAVRAEDGPVAVSVLNEMRAALHRAAVWADQAEGEGEEAREDAAPETEAAPGWTDVLEGSVAEGWFEAAATLARAQDAAGGEWVFLEDGRAVEWRKALIRAVVAKQRIDPRTGGGYWAETRDAPPAARIRATRLALAALEAASGEKAFPDSASPF